MPAHAIPIDGFVEALVGWVNSIHRNKQDHAKAETERLKIYARFLAEDSEFQAIFRANLDNCSQNDPRQAMNCVYAFLNSVADASRPGGFRVVRF